MTDFAFTVSSKKWLCTKPCAMALLFCTATAVADLPMAPPDPPVNWEAEANPAFNPMVEEAVISIHSNYQDEYPRQVWANWPPEAFQYLFALRESPFWTQLHNAIDRLIFSCPYDECFEWIQQELRNSALNCIGTTENSNCMYELGQKLNIAAHGQQEKLFPLLRELAQTNDYDVLARIGSALKSIGRGMGDPLFDEVVNTLANAPDSSIRASAVHLIDAQSAEEYELQLSIAKSVSPSLVDLMESIWERRNAAARAKEPMSLILEREREAGK